MFESRLHVEVNHRRARGKLQAPEQPEVTNQSVTKSLKENFNQYLTNSTLHGLKYVGDRTITRFER